MGDALKLNSTFAVIADIHGNRWALEAVLQDIDLRGIQHIINLGDHLTGPLDPVGTAEILAGRDMIHVCGNDDRDLFLPYEQLSSAQKYTYDHLTSTHLEWIYAQPATTIVAQEILRFIMQWSLEVLMRVMLFFVKWKISGK